MKFLKNWHPLINGIICGVLPSLFGYYIVNWQWWAIAIPAGLILETIFNKIFK